MVSVELTGSYETDHVVQESPHEHQQTLLLSRIITNIEKLNEAVMMMNKCIQVGQSC